MKAKAVEFKIANKNVRNSQSYKTLKKKKVGSGGDKTKLTKQKIMTFLAKGHSFPTTNPVLISRLWGQGVEGECCFMSKQ